MVEASRTLREARERRVLAHGRQRNGPGIGHGNDGLLDVLEAETVYGLSLRKGDVRIVGMTRILFGALDERCQGERLGLDPLTVGLLVGEPVLDFVIVEHATLFRVDHEHLPRSEASRNEDLCRVDVEHARLARQDEAIVGGHTIAGGTQTITVDDRAQHRSVRKRDCGRALPRLGEHRLVLIPGAALGSEHLVLVPRLGKQHRHGTYERAAVHGDELEHVVEHGRVGTLAVEDGQDLLEIGPHDR